MRTMKTIVIILLMSVSLLIFYSQTEPPKYDDNEGISYNQINAQTTGIFTDSRDGKTYKTVKIGDQIWLAENLAYKPDSGNCWAYNDDEKYVSKYGYLYDWESAQKYCPDGWHLPTDQEWQQMVSYLGGDRLASEKLRERGYTHWIDGYSYRPIATNESGFSARPGGKRNENGEYFTIGTYGSWWSATQKNQLQAVYYWLGYMGDYLNKDQVDKKFGLSVRCIKD